MSEFKIGDRVKYVGELPQLNGKVGTIVYLKNNDCGVAFDEYLHLPFSHSLGGLCLWGHGMLCSHVNLELIKDEHRFNVIITSVGDTTTAKLLHGKKVEKEVSVKRYHKDVYSEEAAVEAVCKKLFGKDKPKAAAEPEGINCKAVYVGTSRADFTHGKIYEFSDGRCADDRGEWLPDLGSPKITEFNDPRFKNLFVKLVDGDE